MSSYQVAHLQERLRLTGGNGVKPDFIVEKTAHAEEVTRVNTIGAISGRRL